MSELEKRLEKLSLRLDRMGMRVEEAVIDAVNAVMDNDLDAAQIVYENDSQIDREEVEIEQECIRLLALYQPAAIDLRRICTIIKINNDLERIADFAVTLVKRVKHLVEERLDLRHIASLPQGQSFRELQSNTLEVLGGTMRLLSTGDVETARRVIRSDERIDENYKKFAQAILAGEISFPTDPAACAMTLISLSKAMERIGDLCTNIAEDTIFLLTGDVVRHAGAFDQDRKNNP
jgi:phosphate transport system protein